MVTLIKDIIGTQRFITQIKISMKTTLLYEVRFEWLLNINKCVYWLKTWFIITRTKFLLSPCFKNASNPPWKEHLLVEHTHFHVVILCRPCLVRTLLKDREANNKQQLAVVHLWHRKVIDSSPQSQRFHQTPFSSLLCGSSSQVTCRLILLWPECRRRMCTIGVWTTICYLDEDSLPKSPWGCQLVQKLPIDRGIC